MKKQWLLAGCLAAGPIAQAQTAPAALPDSVRSFLDKSLTLLETYSLERKAVSWPQLRQAAYQRAQGAQSVRELLPIYPYLFEQLQDDHGWLTYHDKTYKWHNAARPRYANAVVKAALAAKPGLRITMLPGRIGYVLLPGINAGGSLQAMRDAAQVVQDSLCRHHPDQAKAWIIDLRLNDGGAMAPMLAGLGALIGDGHLGGFVDKDGKPDEQWYLHQGNFYLDSLQVTTLTDRCPVRRTTKPVAVLLSGLTASSGEIVAIALRGRPVTRSFGEPTYGATTANQSYPIGGGAYLTIAGLLETDRNRVPYRPNLTPDVPIVGGDNFANLRQDAKVAAALRWLGAATKSAR